MFCNNSLIENIDIYLISIFVLHYEQKKFSDTLNLIVGIGIYNDLKIKSTVGELSLLAHGKLSLVLSPIMQLIAIIMQLRYNM